MNVLKDFVLNIRKSNSLKFEVIRSIKQSDEKNIPALLKPIEESWQPVADSVIYIVA